MKKQRSNFHEKVLAAVMDIPQGQYRTYKEVADLANSPRAYRAVGNILNGNNDPQVPCHRVIKSNGSCGGYNKGKTKKIEMLRSEGVLLK